MHMTIMPSARRARRGSSLMEVSAAMLILALVLPMVAQLGYWSIMQRARGQSRQAALDLAHNILESARAIPLDALTPEWASAQKIPADIAPLLPAGTLTVKITPEKEQVRRVAVTVAWQTEAIGPPQQMHLATLLAPRTTMGASP
jgi:hypothetical protein